MERWVRLPTETQEALSEIHAAAEKQAVSIFISGSFNDQEHKHQLELMRSVQERYEEWCRRNALESRRVCRGVLSRVFAGLDEAVGGGSYMRPRGYNSYRSDLEKATQLYRAAEGTGLLREEVLTDYLMEKSAVGENILAADRSLTEAQQRMEAEKMKREEAEQQQRLLEDYNHIQEQAIQDQQRSNQENLRQMEAKMEEQRQRAKEELERAVSAKLKERQESLEEGFKERARLMQEEVDKLKQEQQQQKQQQPQGSSWLDTTADVLETGGMAAAFVPGWGLAGIGSMVVGKVLRWLKK
ncbi:guanylate-binding protein 1-like [Alosa alosa]|nr:guanylate-binding protein 1-like [Alosa alosa]